MQRILFILKKLIRNIVVASGSLFIVLLIFAFTRVPFDFQLWLGTSGTAFNFVPESIVMLGGSGMPSEANLIRLYYTKELAQTYPRSKIIIVHPHDTAVLRQMIDFLVAYGVSDERIYTGSNGTNTRAQGIQLKEHYPGITHEKIVLVTSPEHMYRSLKTLKKLNFKTVGGVAAFENPMFIDLIYDHSKVGGSKYLPDVSGNLDLRYNFWNYFKLEVTCLREFTAIVYYRLNGWI
jgi:uncharacterized SAM-binding protein YcdF (DUF218 family)